MRTCNGQAYLYCVSGVLSLLLATACFGLDRPVVGAIRWDAWQSDGRINAQVEMTLGQSAYQDRLPFFAEVTGPNSSVIDGNRQAVMDQEIAYAADAGLDYWAFVVYPPSIRAGMSHGLNLYLEDPAKMVSDSDLTGMSNGLNLYLNSTQKSRMNFALILQGGWVASEPYADQKSRLLRHFADPDYQTVMNGRPLLYLFDASSLLFSGLSHSFNSYADAKAAFDDLRAASVAAGLGDPYIVVQGSHSDNDKRAMLTLGADAISRYSAPGGSYPTGTPYAYSAAQDKANWNQAAASGAEVVPLASMGWDRRPRYDMGGVFWERGAGSPRYYELPVEAELTHHVVAAMKWVRAHPTAARIGHVLISAWNEHDEGGWLVPTLKADGSIDTTRIDALATALAYPLAYPLGATEP